MPPVHDAAQRGFSAEASTYTSGRPDYPAALEGWLRGTLGIVPALPVLDLGAGTGKFTRLLAGLQANVTAVEPVAAMRDELSLGLPKVPVLDGTAQGIPLGDQTVQVVTCAQAFHWFATAAALAEIHRVLAPGGRLGLVWNVRDESVDWVAAITAILTPYEGDAPRFHTGLWRQAFDGHYFSEPRVATFEHTHEGSPEDVILGRCLSVSFIAALPQAEKNAVAAQLRELVATHPALRGRETVAFPYQTQAYGFVKQPHG
ncbi:class I SAM-dependent methyltransferase [Pseudomonas typographi]|uniref:Methyltransferase domain-containing protein n=1 Tax=Pseudomonas typographi TaxID=2715964 RepID=A0ABR7Z0G7_9PSED|nr:class I SAM-dependent methyltransferase [Pseudomonas typographi]MBD1551311.1 methyltransferase domain-containing protein [Pseudomonas typographi]MBD1588807.1 methyltransferase domain-containing protein [Pseudomonas typographi]MBD1598923.1 methyltransferase domain-containing protein [Pseudomonas typographi]